eukprot:SAG22_NODE_798_length_7130_cov_4.576732_5_plen_489_part_00
MFLPAPSPPAQIYMPFYSSCSSFVESSLPNLVHFSSLCEAQGVTVPPPPPGGAVSSGYAYVEVTFTLANANIGTSAKKQQRFINELRGDVADALDVQQNDVLVNKQTLSTTSATVDVFASDQAHAQALSQKITTQVADATSALRTGYVSDKISGVQGQPQVLADDGGTGGSTDATGTLHIRVDDTADVYFNGEQLGSQTPSQWRNVVSYDLHAPCAMALGSSPNVLAVHGTDAYGVSAFIASWTHCGVTTNTDLGCKCTTEVDPSDSDWTLQEFDETQEEGTWQPAADGGQNGCDPWGPNPDLPDEARWIWGKDMFDTNEVFCRCQEGRTAPVGLTTAGDGQFHIRVDDQSTLYVNGENIGETTQAMWDQVSWKALPFYCASTAFLSKTVPFLAVLLGATGHDLPFPGRLQRPDRLRDRRCRQRRRRRLHRRYQPLRRADPDQPGQVEVLRHLPGRLDRRRLRRLGLAAGRRRRHQRRRPVGPDRRES